MAKNPFVNALTATLYIAVVASLMFYGPERIDPVDSVIMPIAMISLFMLSAAVMAYIFPYKPLVLYFDNQKKEAVKLFLQTVAIFAVITLIILFLLFSGVFVV